MCVIAGRVGKRSAKENGNWKNGVNFFLNSCLCNPSLFIPVHTKDKGGCVTSSVCPSRVEALGCGGNGNYDRGEGGWCGGGLGSMASANGGGQDILLVPRTASDARLTRTTT